MNKLVFAGVGICALFAASSGQAREAVISLDGFCEVLHITTFGHTYATAIDPNTSGQCATFLGEGRIAKLKQGAFRIDGKIADISGIQDSNPEFGVTTYDIQFPFVTGGHWAAYQTTDGRRMHFILQGTYTVTDQSGRSERTGTTRLTDLLKH